MGARRWLGGLAALLLALAMIVPAAAAPPDDEDGVGPDKLPPGLRVRTFIHHEKGAGKSPVGADEVAAITGSCAGDEYGNATCDMYGYSGIRWKSGSAPVYFVNPNFSAKKSKQLTASNALAAIRNSFATWQAITADDLTFTYKSTTTTRPGKYDRKNVIGWGNLSAGTLAVTTVWYYPDGIVEFDMAFNNNYAWSYTPPTMGACDKADGKWCDPSIQGDYAGTYDVQNIGTHEAGHTLMLDDLYDPSTADLTMHGYGGMRELWKDTLGYGDTLGARAIYGN